MLYAVNTSFGHGNEQALKIIKDIHHTQIQNDEEFIIDFSSYNENNPFSNLVIGSTIRNFKKTHTNPIRFNPHSGSYLSHLGFYHMFGGKYGKQIGDAKPTNNYVPITGIKFDGDFYKNIEKESKNLARLLNFDKGLQMFLEYIFIETIRNVYEHSDEKFVFVTAQKWPTMNLLEIAIADTGCGIANSMGKQYKNYDEKDLLYLAGEPGISARSNFSYLDKDDAWRNSGYGLYLLRRLSVAYEGSFLLCSGNYALYQNKDEVREYPTLYSGTAVGIRIRTDTNNDFVEIRNRILREGEKEAREIEGAIKKASRSSGGHYSV